MRCIKCKGNTKVIDSRIRKDGNKRRRRLCLNCGKKFTTIEGVLK